jgi:hypothetical protein
MNNEKEETADAHGVARCLCAAFCHNIDQTLAVLLSDKLSDNEVKILGLKDTEAEVAAAYKKNVIMLAEEKYKCGLEKCSKMFKGADFVKKHIQNKHPEIEKAVRNKVRAPLGIEAIGICGLG